MDDDDKKTLTTSSARGPDPRGLTLAAVIMTATSRTLQWRAGFAPALFFVAIGHASQTDSRISSRQRRRGLRRRPVMRRLLVRIGKLEHRRLAVGPAEEG